jgi:beta-glucosidase
VPNDAYRDPARPLAERVDDLLGRMTIEEKLAQLQGAWVTSLLDTDHFDEAAAVRVLRNGIGQVTRIGASTGLDAAGSAELMNAIQQVAVEQTRLGIPVIVHEESVAGYCARGATVFPQAIGLAASWDPGLLAEIAAVIRDQLLAVGARQALAPVLDVARDPRWGRVEETYGEDPVLAGTLGTAYVRALQGDDLRRGVIATGKHFLAHALSEGGRNHGPVQVGPRELRDVYAEPFAAAIRDAGLASIMNSYSSVDGLPCAGSPAILTGLLRDELGFTGTVVADYRAVVQLHRYHRTAADRAEAAVQALNAGLDVELPAGDCFGEPLSGAVERGEIDVAVIDRAVRRVLTQKIALGLFERPYVDETHAGEVFDTPAQRDLARRAATESVVLLTNDGVLPLAPDIGTVAVLGPAADDRRLLQGDYHYPAHQEIITDGSILRADVEDEVLGGVIPGTDGVGGSSMLPEAGGAFSLGGYYTEHVTPLAGLRRALGEDAVRYERGCEVTGADRSGLAAAADLARRASVAVVFVGGRSGLTPSTTVGEGRDATDLRLTGVQEELVTQVAATGTPMVVVVLSGRVHSLEAIVPSAAAILQAWPLGEEGGSALADILLGRAEPSGRLPVSLPRSAGQAPVYASPRAGGTKAMFSGSYTDAPATPLFPLGHGLSYTSFEYGPLTVRSGDTTEEIHATAEISNTGPRAGVEVVQLYASDRFASVARPGRQLVGFARVSLEPGERCRVSFIVHPSRLAFYDPEMRFVVEPGAFGFAVASSSLNVRQQSLVEVAGAATEYRQREVIATVTAVEHLPPTGQEESAARLATAGMTPPAPDGPAPAPANGARTPAGERSTR